MFKISQRPHLLSFAPEAEPGGAPAPVTDPAPEPVETLEPAPAAPEATDPPAEPSGDAPETFSREYVEKLRRENAATREKAKTDAAAAADAARSEVAQQIGKALGLVKDDEPVDPDALLKQAQAERQTAIDEANATKRDLAVLRNAEKHDANVEELLESVSFGRKLAALDPTADDFASQVDALIKDTVDGNPTKFKRVQVAQRTGGGDHSGEGASQLSREQLAALPPAERLKAAREGRLSSLLKN
ncbi:hypothetical protein ACTJJ4_07640 [Microbacterium sp. 22195]|uniref:hypothetical protein n=1 Tax=Microbacterium sp. 22195 TaxID=3453891 RepID=UPI003F83B718